MPSLLEALERKYCAGCELEDESGAGAGDVVSIYIPKLPPLQSVPELLVLNDCDIDCAGDFDAIKEKCQRVRELDLAQNKLRDWAEVFHILEHMPRIEFLNLSKNHLIGPLSGCPAPAPSISNLRSIVLNGTYLDWLCVDVLLENLPILEELHLSLNNYTDVLIDAAVARSSAGAGAGAEAAEDSNRNPNRATCCSHTDTDRDPDRDPDPTTSPDNDNGPASDCKQIEAHTALKTLHFTGNPIENWCAVCRLGRVFPNLENLVLAECPIRSIHAAEERLPEVSADSGDSDEGVPEPPYKYFSNLLFLNLSCANINTWDDIDRLARFPRLRHLRVKNWPLWERLECTEHERRQLLIARLPNVQILNGGGVISADEREDAERAFIRYYMERPESDRPARYEELVARHGRLDPLVDVNLKPEKRVKVLLTRGDKSETRLVDIYRSVADLKVRLEKVLGLPANKMRLYYVDQDYREFGPEEMKYPNKLLYSYNIQAGDEIIIDEKK